MAKDLVRLLEREQPKDTGDLKTAKQVWQAFREKRGLKGTPTLLTPPEGNAKFAHTPIPVYGLSLAPHTISGEWNVCRYSTPNCRAGCIFFAGHGELPRVIKVRTVRTSFLAEHPHEFVTLLNDEINQLKKKYGRKKFGIRLNAFSDLLWETIVPWLFEVHANVQFYDYTKWPLGHRLTPKNYHLTYSVSERTTEDQALDILTGGGNIAMVTNVRKGEDMPEGMNIGGMVFDVVDGDASDARYVDASMGDEQGVIIGLRAKGRMRKGDWPMVKKVA